MSTSVKHIASLSAIPENEQKTLHEHSASHYDNNPFKPRSTDEVLSELAESRACYDRGEYKDMDDALDEISKKYGL